MLTTDQKVILLRKAGVAVPDLPACGPTEQPQQADAQPILKENMQADGRRDATGQWTRTIEALFDRYSAECSARSLRDAQEVRRLEALRGASGDQTA